MRLKRPDISEGPWVHHVDTVWRGKHKHPIVFHPINNRRSIADSLAASQLPEMMDRLEGTLEFLEESGWNPLLRDDILTTMLAMGYTELPEPEPEPTKPESET